MLEGTSMERVSLFTRSLITVIPPESYMRWSMTFFERPGSPRDGDAGVVNQASRLPTPNGALLITR